MNPRIDVTGIGLDQHGAIDHRALEPASASVARQAFDQLVKPLDLVEPRVVEAVRLRNAHRQQCHL